MGDDDEISTSVITGPSSYSTRAEPLNIYKPQEMTKEKLRLFQLAGSRIKIQKLLEYIQAMQLPKAVEERATDDIKKMILKLGDKEQKTRRVPARWRNRQDVLYQVLQFRKNYPYHSRQS